jgi:tRNA(fMet)-specific endonuclease VapC
MDGGPVLLDTDTLSELSRGNLQVSARARVYLAEFGRFTIAAVTVFERLRGYRDAIRSGKPFERQMHAFEALVGQCVVLPFDAAAADVAATIWSTCSRRHRRHLGDILIAATAISRQIPLATRNTKDFRVLRDVSGVDLALVDWTRAPARRARSGSRLA